MDVPLNAHVFQLVTNLASRAEVVEETEAKEEENEIDCDEEIDDKDDVTPEAKEIPRSKDLRLLRRKPIRNPRVGPRKTKPWSESNSVLYGVDLGLPPNVKQSDEEEETSPPPEFPMGGVDPFDAFGLLKNPTTDMALHHWVNVFQHTRMATTPRGAWLKINLSDKTLLAVTTYCSIYHYYFIRRMRPPQACLYQKVNAIQHLNSALRKPGHIPNDYTMVAVATMTLIECLAGAPTACTIHRKGLQLMVKARGGLQNLGLNGGAQRIVSWADTACAILTREKPSLKPTLIPSLGESESPSPTLTTHNLPTRLLSLTTSKHLTKGILYIYHRLHYLTTFLTSHTHTIDDYYWSDKLDFLERQILSLLHSDTLNECPAAAFVTAFLNAGLIYIVEELRECPKYTNVGICLSERICSGLQMVDLGEITGKCPDLLAWMLVLGKSGVLPGEGMGRGWYEGLLGELEIKVEGVVGGLRYFEIAEGMMKGRVKDEECESFEGKVVEEIGGE